MSFLLIISSPDYGKIVFIAMKNNRLILPKNANRVMDFIIFLNDTPKKGSFLLQRRIKYGETQKFKIQNIMN